MITVNPAPCAAALQLLAFPIENRLLAYLSYTYQVHCPAVYKLPECEIDDVVVVVVVVVVVRDSVVVIVVVICIIFSSICMMCLTYNAVPIPAVNVVAVTNFFMNKVLRSSISFFINKT